MRFARLLALLALAASPLAAQGFIDPIRPVPQGSVTRVRTDVSVSITGRVARVTVEEYFLNTGPLLGEANYVYPIPPDAAFAGLSLWQGDQEMKGEMLDAGQARSIYEEIVRRRRDPALVELAGYGLIRARMFPIAPGETKKVTLRYNEIVTRAGDALRFRYPIGGSAAGAAPRTMRFTVDSAPSFGAPFSPTHQLATTRDGDRLSIAVSDTGAPHDLEMFLPVRTAVGASLVTYHPVGEDAYFMLLLAPGAVRDAAVQPRDVVAVLDISGSMSGVKIDQAKAALRQLLGTLRESDRFRLIAFSSDVRRYATDWTVATNDARSRATEWVDALSADGGTNIAGALSEAFAARPAPGRLGIVVFLTDGLPTVGESDPEKLVAQADHDRGGYRVFSFGIGYDVNTYLLDRLTEQARGATEYIRPGDNIESAVGALAAKVSSPVLTDVSLAASGGAELYDLQPGQLPDLFAGDETVIMGRVRGAGSGEWSLAVSGRRNGAPEHFAATGDGAEHQANDYVARLWANRKAGALAREVRLHGPTPELLQSLKQLALRYGILTEYTAYLVQEPTPVAQRRAEERFLNTPQAAPTVSTGAGAVAKATRDAQQAQATTVEADRAMLDEMTRGRAGIAPTQRIGGRLFILRDSVWTDLGHKDGQRVVKVAPFSDAYFALMHALPELAKPATLGGNVLVAGSAVSVEICDGGLDSLTPGQVAELVKEFR